MRIRSFTACLLAVVLLLAGCQARTPAGGGENSLPGATRSEALTAPAGSAASQPGVTAPSHNPETTRPPTASPSQSSSSAAPTAPVVTYEGVPDKPPAASAAVGKTEPTPSPSAPAPSAPGLTPLTPAQYYGRRLLEKDGDSRLLEAYQRMTACCAAYRESADLTDLGLTLEEANRVFLYFLDDYPQYFWLDNQCTFQYFLQSKKVIAFEPRYTIAGAAAIDKAKAAVEAQAAILLEGLHDGMDEFERERLIHDRLIRWVEYDVSQSKPHIHTLYGALANREAVCDGYARAFQYLMGQAGLQCLLVRGNAGGEGHAWNVARINGAYYQVDVTWDDPVGMDDPDYVYYGYLNLTDADMTRDHTPETEIPLPVCAATADNYFLRGGYTASALEAGQFGDAVARQVHDGARGWYQILYTGAALSEERLADFLNGNAEAIRSRASKGIAGGRLPALSRYALNDNIIQLLFE